MSKIRWLRSFLLLIGVFFAFSSVFLSGFLRFFLLLLFFVLLLLFLFGSFGLFDPLSFGGLLFFIISLGFLLFAFSLGILITYVVFLLPLFIMGLVVLESLLVLGFKLFFFFGINFVPLLFGSVNSLGIVFVFFKLEGSELEISVQRSFGLVLLGLIG